MVRPSIFSWHLTEDQNLAGLSSTFSLSEVTKVLEIKPDLAQVNSGLHPLSNPIPTTQNNAGPLSSIIEPVHAPQPDPLVIIERDHPATENPTTSLETRDCRLRSSRKHANDTQGQTSTGDVNNTDATEGNLPSSAAVVPSRSSMPPSDNAEPRLRHPNDINNNLKKETVLQRRVRISFGKSPRAAPHFKFCSKSYLLSLSYTDLVEKAVFKIELVSSYMEELANLNINSDELKTSLRFEFHECDGNDPSSIGKKWQDTITTYSSHQLQVKLLSRINQCLLGYELEYLSITMLALILDGRRSQNTQNRYTQNRLWAKFIDRGNPYITPVAKRNPFRGVNREKSAL
jgi:hypothetical protein